MDTAFDPFDPAQQAVHHQVMAELRARCPFARLASGMVVLSRFDDVKSALNDPALRNSHAGRAPGVAVPPKDRLFFFEYDPPEHLQLRRLLLDLFARQRMERVSPRMRALVDELLRPLVADGGGEVVATFSVPLAGRLMMRVAGFPESDYSWWRQQIKDMVVSGFSFTNRNERGAGVEQCYPDVLGYLDAHLDERVADDERPDDVLTRVATGRTDGEPLSRTHQRMILFSVVSGGTNTLVNFVSNTFLSLAKDPALLQALRADRSLVPVAVEESLRRDAPSMYITRVAPDGCQFDGTTIAPGEKVLVGLASANRDETVYPRPDKFGLDRADQPTHLAFGWGAHLCIGAPLVRELGAVLLNVFLDAVATMEVEPGTAPVPYLSPQGNGLDELHVRLHASPQVE